MIYHKIKLFKYFNDGASMNNLSILSTVTIHFTMGGD